MQFAILSEEMHPAREQTTSTPLKAVLSLVPTEVVPAKVVPAEVVPVEGAPSERGPAEGIKVRVTRTVTRINWAEIHPDIRHSLVKELAEQFASSLSGTPGIKPIKITLVKIVGDLDNRRDVLKHAMIEALARYDIHVNKAGTHDPNIQDVQAEDKHPSDDIFLTGNMAITPLGNDRAALRIVWTVTLSSGEIIGEAEQANDLPISTVESSWEELASVIADAVAPDLADVIRSASEINNTD